MLSRSAWMFGVCGLTMAGCADAGSDAVVENSSFDRRCADELCDWQQSGSVVRAHSWHRDDLAVSFESQGAEITQLVQKPGFSCFVFDSIAKLDEVALLTLYVEFDDGSQRRQVLVGSNWENIAFAIPAPPDYQSVRFTVRKEGTGRAVLAQLRVEGSSACGGSALSTSELTE